jgi:hypothetical protein
MFTRGVDWREQYSMVINTLRIEAGSVKVQVVDIVKLLAGNLLFIGSERVQRRKSSMHERLTYNL